MTCDGHDRKRKKSQLDDPEEQEREVSRRNSKRDASRAERQREEEYSGTHLDVCTLIESIHLIQQLEQNPLNLSIRSGLSIESLGGDGVDLVDEYDGGSILSCESEDVSDHSGTLQIGKKKSN